MADAYSRPDHWTDMLPQSWQQSINTNPILNALGRAMNRRPADIEGASKRIFAQPGDREMDDRAWLLQQAQPQRRLNPLAAEMLDKGGLLANFLGPGMKLPPMAPKPTGIRAYHGSPHDFNAERLVRYPDGRTEYVVGVPDRLPDIPKGAELVRDYPLGRFREDRVGTGEGAQAYGRGVAYVAESEGVARSYRDGLSRNTVLAGNKSIPIAGGPRTQSVAYNRQYDNLTIAEKMLADHNGNYDRAIRDLQELANIKRMNPNDKFIPTSAEEYEAAVSQLKGMRTGEWAPPGQGRMYEVNIKADPDQFLDWDKPLSQQPEGVRKALATAGVVAPERQAIRSYDDALLAALDGAGPTSLPKQPHDPTGEGAYRSVAERFRYGKRSGDPLEDVLLDMPITDHEAAARRLRDAGIPGIKYLDQGSRVKGEGSRNYVVFDDKLIEILRKYGLFPPVAAGTAAALNQQEPAQ